MSSPPICLYKSKICDTKIIPGGVCIEEYIPLGMPSPATASSRATTGMQHNDIQYPDHETKADLECVRQAVASQGQRSVQGTVEIHVHAVNEQMMGNDQYIGNVQMMNKAKEGLIRSENCEHEMSDRRKIKRKKLKEYINQMSRKGLGN